ncbi:MAG: SAM-dependent methyltransferase [Armatimonadota bacterium]
MITIAGLGPSGRDYISMGAYRVILHAPIVFVRTARHPAVEDLAAEGINLQPLDYIYESSDTFEEVYRRIAEKILDEAADKDVVYAVPGHPLMGEHAVEVLIHEARQRGMEFRIVGSESFIEASMEALEIGLDAGLKIIDALSMENIHPDPCIDNLIYQVYDRSIASDVKLKLMDQYPDDFHITAVVGAGTANPEVVEMPLYELDRRDWDHLTTIYVPRLGEAVDTEDEVFDNIG